jgi:CAAX prenyl protease-like protein
VPFATLIALLALFKGVDLKPEWAYPIRTLVVLGTLVAFSRGVLSFRPSQAVLSALAGVAVFGVWVAPDLLWPGYHGHWLFQNALMGSAPAAPSASLRNNLLFLFFRCGGSALLVPVVEELFWRAWLMRRVISSDVETVPMGAYAARSFWVTALLFASEHGMYWDVGLAAGVIYGWWMVRTRNLGDCILAHTVTNACLAAYVLVAGRWEYWL